jgi:hypothetical protein
VPILYRHIRTDKQEVFYIGIGENESRAYNKKNRTRVWKNTANKGYETEILFEDVTWEQVIEKEKEFIALYGRKDLGLGTLVNLTDGGEGTIGYKHTDEAKEKNRLASTGKNNPWYKKERPDHSLKMQGDKNPCFGRVGDKNPAFGKPGYWTGRIGSRAKQVTYEGKQFESQTALAKYLNKSKAYVTKILKRTIKL